MKTGKKILAQPFLPWLVLGVLTLVWHLGLVIVDGDEVFYGSVLGQQPLWEFLVQQYQGWSSRTVIEGFLCLFSTLPRWVWRLCDSAVIVGLALCLDRLVQGPAGETSLPAPARQKDRWVIACVLWLYPWWYLSTAGWVATTMNYLWPLAGLCLAMCSLAGYGGRAGRIAGLLGLVYAVNAEQSAVLAVFLLAGYGLFCLANRRPVPRLLWVQAAVTAAGLVYMLASPGVKARTQNEIASYYKDFPMQSFLAKAEAGISGALGELFLDRNLLYTLFLLLLAAAVWQRTAHIFYRLLVLVPLGVQLGLGVFFRHYKDRVPALRDAVEAARGVGTIHVANCNQAHSLPALFAHVRLFCHRLRLPVPGPGPYRPGLRGAGGVFGRVLYPGGHRVHPGVGGVGGAYRFSLCHGRGGMRRAAGPADHPAPPVAESSGRRYPAAHGGHPVCLPVGDLNPETAKEWNARVGVPLFLLCRGIIRGGRTR